MNNVQPRAAAVGGCPSTGDLPGYPGYLESRSYTGDYIKMTRCAWSARDRDRLATVMIEWRLGGLVGVLRDFAETTTGASGRHEAGRFALRTQRQPCRKSRMPGNPLLKNYQGMFYVFVSHPFS
jgi:hypothetical protein